MPFQLVFQIGHTSSFVVSSIHRRLLLQRTILKTRYSKIIEIKKTSSNLSLLLSLVPLLSRQPPSTESKSQSHQQQVQELPSSGSCLSTAKGSFFQASKTNRTGSSAFLSRAPSSSFLLQPPPQPLALENSSLQPSPPSASKKTFYPTPTFCLLLFLLHHPPLPPSTLPSQTISTTTSSTTSHNLPPTLPRSHRTRSQVFHHELPYLAWISFVNLLRRIAPFATHLYLSLFITYPLQRLHPLR